MERGYDQIAALSELEFERAIEMADTGYDGAESDAVESGHELRSGFRGGRHSISLNQVVMAWPTPAARDFKGENSEEHALVTGGGRKHMDQLANYVAHSPQAQAIQDGERSSEDTQDLRRRLNPAFVNWLQGNPFWWTNPEQISCAAAEIRLWRSKQLQRLSDLLGD